MLISTGTKMLTSYTLCKRSINLIHINITKSKLSNLFGINSSCLLFIEEMLFIYLYIFI